MDNPNRGGNFILNGGRNHKRSKSSGKVSKSHTSSKFYENSTDDSCSGGNESGRSRFFEVYENQQRYEILQYKMNRDTIYKNSMQIIIC